MSPIKAVLGILSSAIASYASSPYFDMACEAGGHLSTHFFVVRQKRFSVTKKLKADG